MSDRGDEIEIRSCNSKSQRCCSVRRLVSQVEEEAFPCLSLLKAEEVFVEREDGQ